MITSKHDTNNSRATTRQTSTEKKNEERKDLVALHILSATADTFNYFYLGKRGGENCLEYFEEITDL